MGLLLHNSGVAHSAVHGRPANATPVSIARSGRPLAALELEP